MSSTLNQDFQFWKSLEARLRGGGASLSGHTLSERDTCVYIHALVLLGLLAQDLWIATYPRSFSNKRVANWLVAASLRDAGDFLEELKALNAMIKRWEPDAPEEEIPDFKHRVSEQCPTLRRFLGEPINDFLQNRNPVDMWSLNTFTSFITRLTLKDVDWVVEENYAAYLEFEERIKTQQYDPDLLASLHQLALVHLPKKLRYGRPLHGGGATASEKRGAGEYAKYLSMRHTSKTLYFSRRLPDHLPPLPGIVDDQYCSLEFVPKGLNKRRVISMEPTVNMYYQASVSEALDNMFRNDPWWHVDLHEQGHNRRLAQRGSYDRKFATIDLSSASDSVTWTLVKAIFQGTSIYPALLCTRTNSVKYKEDIIPLEKFAPMGSRCCFPVECMVFSLIVQLAQERVGIHTYYRVYGDDIVVHESCYEEVVRLLTELHFDVNIEKSFAPQCSFKESCGIECYSSFDVTPLRLSRSYSWGDTSRDQTAWVSQVDLCNSCFKLGFFRVRRFELHPLIDEESIPFSYDEEGTLWTYDPTNYRIRQRVKRWEGEPTWITEWRITNLENREDLLSKSVDLPAWTVPTLDEFRYARMLEEYAYTERTALRDPIDLINPSAGRRQLRKKCSWSRKTS